MLDGRWMLVLGLGVVAGVSWVILRAMAPAFVATVSWTLATGPATPRVGAEAFRQVLVQDGVLGEQLGLTASEASTGAVPAATENRLDVVAGLGDGARVTLLRLRVTERTPWTVLVVARDAARKLEAWDRRSASAVVPSLIADVDAAIEVLTGEIRVRQVFEVPASAAAVQTDLNEREELVGFRDRLLAFAEGAPSGLMRRSGAVSVFLSPGASPAAVTAAPLLAVTVGMLALLMARGIVGGVWSYWVGHSARRLLATVPGVAPDDDEAVRHAIGAIADAILERRVDGPCAIVAFTSPVASAAASLTCPLISAPS